MAVTVPEDATVEVETEDGSTNDAFRFFFSVALEVLGVGAVERATTARTVLFLIASRTFSWSSGLLEEISSHGPVQAIETSLQ